MLAGLTVSQHYLIVQELQIVETATDNIAGQELEMLATALVQMLKRNNKGYGKEEDDLVKNSLDHDISKATFDET